MSFGKIIADARKKNGISQKTLAAHIYKEDGESISAQYLNDIERDRRNPPSEEFIKQFAKELGIPHDFLMLAAGMVPQDVSARMRDSDPEKVEQALRAFRRTIK